MQIGLNKMAVPHGGWGRGDTGGGNHHVDNARGIAKDPHVAIDDV
jgi:hypothetical protein